MRHNKILVIDDDPFVQRTLTDILKYKGYETEISGNGEDGLKKIKRRVFDVILLDLRLPDKDGVEILKEIKMIRPDAIVIMLTGYPTVDSVKEAMRSGAYDYVTKTINSDKLNTLIENALRDKNVI